MTASLPSKDDILKFIETSSGETTRREIARAFDIKGAARAELRALLKEMTEEGLIDKSGRKRMAKAGALPEVTVIDIVDQDADGELLGAPTQWKGEAAPPRIYLAPGEGRTGGARPAIGVGDRALARLTSIDGGAYEARIIKRLGQSAHRILGVFRKTPTGGRIDPVDRKSRHDVIIAKADVNGAKTGDLVYVVLKRERRYGLKHGEVKEIVGSINDQTSFSVIALADHNIPTGFSDAELKEAEDAKPAPLKGRTDLRDTPLLTIDPADARDHDDAVYAAPDADPKNKGGWRIIVAIADVAYYVPPGSALDKGAAARGNSVYLPDRVVPMLPERLSNGLCSLREREDRPCLAVEMIFDKSGRKRGHKFLRAIMRSAVKLSYEEAQTAFDGAPCAAAAPFAKDVLAPLYSAYKALVKARETRSPLDLDMPERRIVFKDGKVDGVKLRDRFDAHRLIEECMIQANVAAAETLEAARLPFIYRVHDEPDPEKLEAARDYLQSIGYPFAKGQVVTAKTFNEILAKAKERDESELAGLVVLRSQCQAVYTTDNAGHFGLNLRRYAHFTSPIRRYADLTVHRALIKACKLGSDGAKDIDAEALEETAQTISNFERRAMAAERDSVDRFMAAWLQDRVGAEFDARIAGVTRFGVFVRLEETGADGLIPIRTLGTEYYRHEEAVHALVGETTGRAYRLGQKVRVRLEEATPVAGGLVFDMLSPPGPAPKTRKSSGRKGRGRKDAGRKSGARKGKSRKGGASKRGRAPGGGKSRR